MKLLLSNILISSVLIGALSACKKEPAPNFHFEYFGYAEGRYVIYDVIEITHDKQINQHDTLIYQLKTKWGAPFIDNQNREGKEFLRFTRSSPSEPWMLADKWFGLIDGIRAEIVEENQRMVKLIFSPTRNKIWDLNAWNIEKEANSYYTEIHQDTIINGLKIDSTLTVRYEVDFPSLLKDVDYYEKYAKNIGLIQKHYKNNRYFNFGDIEIGEGSEIYYTYVSSGKE